MLGIISIAMLFGATGGHYTSSSVKMALWRLDCGRFENVDRSLMSDDDRYKGKKESAVNSCYLIKHGDQYMLWDAGLAVKAKTEFRGGTVKGPDRSLVDQLADIGVRPGQINIVGLSHNHPDHTGQVGSFPNATLIIGIEDWPLWSAPGWTESGAFDRWINHSDNVEKISKDKDVFGDGTVTMLSTPGHTRGHHSLMIHLAGRTVMLSGDLYGSRESFTHHVVPVENVDRADTIASFERFERLAVRYHATVIIQHEPNDVGKLPPFPQYAR